MRRFLFLCPTDKIRIKWEYERVYSFSVPSSDFWYTCIAIFDAAMWEWSSKTAIFLSVCFQRGVKWPSFIPVHVIIDDCGYIYASHCDMKTVRDHTIRNMIPCTCHDDDSVANICSEDANKHLLLLMTFVFSIYTYKQLGQWHIRLKCIIVCITMRFIFWLQGVTSCVHVKYNVEMLML